MSHRVFRPKLPGISRVVAAASKLIADGRKPPRPRRLALEPLEARCLLASSSAGLGDFHAAFPTDVPAAAPALVARASEFGSVRVIVEVDEAASQATVAQRARAHGATIVHQYERFPMLVVEADAAGLEALVNAPQVVALVEDDASCDGNAPCVMSYTSDQIRGLERVLELSESYTIAAANMSIGGSTGYSSPCDSDSRKTVIDKLRSANVATVIAAGNDAYPSSVSAPACISTAIAFGSTSNTVTVSIYTNRVPLLELFES